MPKSPLTYEEMLTIVAEIEAILNSRPLLPTSEDPEDLNYISPAHFLIQRSLTTLPNAQGETIVDTSTRWKRTQQILNILWKKWSSDYLQSLQQRAKWHSSTPNLKIGMLVLIKDINTSPSMWPTARITQVFPGRDNKIRVVELQTSKGRYKRSIHCICPFPTDN